MPSELFVISAASRLKDTVLNHQAASSTVANYEEKTAIYGLHQLNT